MTTPRPIAADRDREEPCEVCLQRPVEFFVEGRMLSFSVRFQFYVCDSCVQRMIRSANDGILRELSIVAASTEDLRALHSERAEGAPS